MAAAFSVCLCVLLLPAVSGLQSEDRECAFADHLQGAETHSEPTNELRGEVRENGTVRCSRSSRCYGMWEKRADGKMQLVKQGCWIHVGDQQECHGDRCLLTATPSQIQSGSYRFCCCSQDLCNTNFTEAPPTTDTPDFRPIKINGRDDAQTDQQPLKREETALAALVTVAIAAVIIIALFLGYRMMKGKQKHSLSALDEMEAAHTESSVDLNNLKLLELIGRGRYGTVFRGDLNERCVAVKLFSATNRQNFANECSIYSLPLLQQHNNIAHFLTADERTTVAGQPEFLIVMENYPHGSLCQYLSLHTVDWWTCLRMCLGVTKGLSFLHSELCRADQYKPAVAHRDLTSRNVLVRADLTCVLADFGLSMKLSGTRTSRHGDDDTIIVISEVGTVRYMAPEVLGGALNLRDCESALKQVDVYALGLIYWESFRRCCDLFPGESVPEFQLAFQAELGNHPSFEEMQILVVREKHRPKFPEVWKENNSLLHSLKETMEDCWDQDAEARLTAQCAEERLYDLLTTHTAIYNHRNLSHGRWSPQVGSSPYIEDVQVGVVKNLQPDASPVVRTTSEGSEKNRNSINYERQQAQSQARSSSSDRMAMTPGGLNTICESEHSGTVSNVSVCLQLSEEDLEATKLDPRQVNKNLRENSDENLMEHSQKQFSSQPQTTLLTDEVNSSISAHGELCGAGPTKAPPPPCSTHPLRKQQNLPMRPTSLQLVPKAKEKLGKVIHRQVETGVAKMNTLTVVTAAAPHLVTTVTYNSNTRGSSATTVATGSCSAGVPTLVTNGMTGGGRTNPAGPQLEEEETPTKEDNGRVNLNFSPDEHEPLLRSEESRPHSHRQPRARNILSGRSSNFNNNNNRGALGSEVKSYRMKGLKVTSGPTPELPTATQQPTAVEDRGGVSSTDPCPQDVLVPEQMLTIGNSRTSEAPLVSSTQVYGAEAPRTQDILDSLTQEHSAAQAPASDPEDSSQQDPTSEDPAPQPVGSETSKEAAAVQMKLSRTRRLERPCSLDLSSCRLPSDEVVGSLSASGEKIKRRVKTPYTLKKWRPASWVISMETTLDPDLEFDVSSLPNIVQSKSSMAVFLVGGGAKSSTTSDPNGMTCF